MDYLLFFAGIALIVLASYFISAAVYRRMTKNGSKAATVVGVITFVVSVLLIGFSVLALVLMNVRVER
ncbi:hypothetical protein [Puia sp.]|jgi:hypothetical protein|uniref:hypothetical protein n=1 Tax=Puia sp. TaxID=2045100 RepID=UPI002F41F00D